MIRINLAILTIAAVIGCQPQYVDEPKVLTYEEAEEVYVEEKAKLDRMLELREELVELHGAAQANFQNLRDSTEKAMKSAANIAPEDTGVDSRRKEALSDIDEAERFHDQKAKHDLARFDAKIKSQGFRVKRALASKEEASKRGK